MANARNTCWVERVNGQIQRIFRSLHGEAFLRAIEANTVETCPKKDAVGAIRQFVWNRCGGRCEWCGKPVTETGPLWKRMHCHERIHKSVGGEVSIENCVGLCQSCHMDKAHGDRKPQWSGGKSFEEMIEGTEHGQ